MKKYSAILIILLTGILITSCSFEPDNIDCIDSVDDAKRAANIGFLAAGGGVILGCQGTNTSTYCLTRNLPDGGTLELCLVSPEELKGSDFYDDLDSEEGYAFSLSYSQAHLTCPETGNEYVLDGDLVAFGNYETGDTSADIFFVLYGDMAIDGEDICDTAQFDTRYTATMTIVGSQPMIRGSIEGTVNGYDVTNGDWKYAIDWEYIIDWGVVTRGCNHD